MARTKAQGGGRATGGKAPRKIQILTPSSKSSKRSSSGGGAPYHPRPTPAWQKGIKNFFLTKEDEGASTSNGETHVAQSTETDSEFASNGGGVATVTSNSEYFNESSDDEMNLDFDENSEKNASNGGGVATVTSNSEYFNESSEDEMNLDFDENSEKNASVKDNSSASNEDARKIPSSGNTVELSDDDDGNHKDNSSCNADEAEARKIPSGNTVEFSDDGNHEDNSSCNADEAEARKISSSGNTVELSDDDGNHED